MPTVNLSPIGNQQFVYNDGSPADGSLLWTYIAGSTTPLATYTAADGITAQTNPIVYNSLGLPTIGEIFLINGLTYDLVWEDKPIFPATHGAVLKTFEDIDGINDSATTTSQWISSGLIPTYISAVSFSLGGDQTSEFHKGRMLQFLVTSGTVYGKIINSVFAASITTVTMLMLESGVLDAGLSSANLSFLRADHSALPNPIEFIRSTVAATTTTTPIWDQAYGEVQDWTGVVAITALPNAPRSGAQRQVYPAAGASIANGGNITVQGNATYTAVAGDKWIITAITTTTFYVEIVKKDGSALVATSKIQPINVVMAANAVTITLNPTVLDFRSATLGSGTVNTRTISSAITVSISSGSTAGTINAIASRIIILAIDNAGTVELAWVNQSGGTLNFSESGLISTTAEGGAGAADSATVVYSTTARANVPYRIVGFFDSTQTTAGTWATAASTIQGAGGNSLNALLGATWLDVTASRALNTTYYNTTGQDIYVSAWATNGGGGVVGFNSGGAEVYRFTGPTASVELPIFSKVVPGKSYLLANGGIATLTKWFEFR